MVRKRTGIVDPSHVLAAMQACREAMIELQCCNAYRSAIYREATAVMRDIDDLALLITGKRDYFAAPRHSTDAIAPEP